MDDARPRAIQLTTLVAIDDALVSADVGEEIVMLHAKTNAYYDANAVGADICRLIVQPIVVRDVCARLLEHYDVDPATCERDVLDFLRDAHTEGIVRIVDDRP